MHEPNFLMFLQVFFFNQFKRKSGKQNSAKSKNIINAFTNY